MKTDPVYRADVELWQRNCRWLTDTAWDNYEAGHNWRYTVRQATRFINKQPLNQRHKLFGWLDVVGDKITMDEAEKYFSGENK